MDKIVYILLRLGVGISMFGHGLVRLLKLNSFSNWLVIEFKKSVLPEFIVIPFSYALPFAEFLVGLLLLMGLFTRTALLTGAIIILLLLFGTSMIENWEAIPSQLIHLAFFCILLQYFEVNTLTLNKLFQKSKKYDQ
ncbi:MULTISPECIES: DoxX family membrane protein [Flavobacterium]|uniref:DoxX family protein n=1 Tax=Flavobacterium tructae TaxID=1114873 RepID=A0A1S1J3T2_9FLAO|nr:MULTISPECIES: DoxX family membrane protein [Flavobacterium]MDL2142320.1 DoxX family membrane protein [Flavobacterium tructae]OHT45317.1 DoxX family protein [Flavobacterium tructae]OXB17740.1 DoxX family protein [Flavobacterium tructae]